MNIVLFNHWSGNMVGDNTDHLKLYQIMRNEDRKDTQGTLASSQLFWIDSSKIVKKKTRIFDSESIKFSSTYDWTAKWVSNKGKVFMITPKDLISNIWIYSSNSEVSASCIKDSVKCFHEEILNK